MPDPESPSCFPVTSWTLVERVRQGSPEEVRKALETLCRAYWHPLYCVARRRMSSVHDAQDAVQGFFETVLRRDSFSTADPSKGRLRQFMLKAFELHCRQQWARGQRQKRGSGVEHVELGGILDFGKGEQHYLEHYTTGSDIDDVYNKAWASALLERSLQTLREDYTRRGWQERYDDLVGPLLRVDDDSSLADLAAQRGVSPGALRMSLHRMRQHFREVLERELATTLDTEDPKLIREEMMELFKAFSVA
ncbi:MAG: RNA polymerase sigma factor [Prosthecobacter sp.]